MTAGTGFEPHGTTILCVRRNGVVAMGGDGQVTLGNTVMKGNARKVRRLHEGKVIAGFAGGTADAFTLFERFEAKLTQYGNLTRAAIELWRRAAVEAPDVVDRARGERVQAMMDAVADYTARSLGVDATTDPRPRLIGGGLAGLELALIEIHGRSDIRTLELLDAAARLAGTI